MTDAQSREANLARLKALANDPTPENIRRLIDLIENLWIGDGFQRETDSDGTTIFLTHEQEFNKNIVALLAGTRFWKLFHTLEKFKTNFVEFSIPKEAMK